MKLGNGLIFYSRLSWNELNGAHGFVIYVPKRSHSILNFNPSEKNIHSPRNGTWTMCKQCCTNYSVALITVSIHSLCFLLEIVHFRLNMSLISNHIPWESVHGGIPNSKIDSDQFEVNSDGAPWIDWIEFLLKTVLWQWSRFSGQKLKMARLF